MLTDHIAIGRNVEVRTKGAPKGNNIAPPLSFTGKLFCETPNYIEITYMGQKLIFGTNGKVIGSEPGERVQRIYCSTVSSVRQVSRSF